MEKILRDWDSRQNTQQQLQQGQKEWKLKVVESPILGKVWIRTKKVQKSLIKLMFIPVIFI